MRGKKTHLQAARTETDPPVAPSDLWERLAQLDRDNLCARPPDSFTTIEYAQRRGISRNKAQNDLERLAKLGKIRKQKVPASSYVYWFLV